MTRRKLIEDAATFASAMAADRVEYPWTTSGDIQDALGVTLDALNLAFQAVSRSEMLAWNEAWADACSILRNGELP